MTGEKLILDKENPKVEGMTIHHDDTITPKWRNNIMDEYQKVRVPFERKRVFELANEDLKKKGLKK
jgi:hypothetical protein